MHDWNTGWHMGWMALWWLGAPVLIALLLWAGTRERPSAEPRDESPEQILKRRYAKGEIDREAYQRALADLGG